MHTKQAAGQKELVRAFGLPSAVILFVSSIIGSGVYKKVVPMSEGLQSPGLVLLAWVLAGLVTLLGVLTTAEIGSMITTSGGPYAYFKRIYGQVFAYFYGWTSFSVIQSASIASIAYVFSQSVNAVVELPRLGPEWEAWTVLWAFRPLENLGVKVVAVALIISLVTINYRGVEHGGWVSKVITVLVVASLALIVLLGIAFGDGNWENVMRPASGYPPASFSGSLGIVGPMFAAMLAAFWAYEGWLNIGFIGDEVKNPQRTIPLALTIGIAIIISIYLAVNFTYLYVVPMDQMIALAQDTNTIAAVAVIKQLFGQPGLWFISLLIIITTLGCTNATILTAARIYFAMGRDGYFSKRAARIHPTYRTPGNALLMQMVWSCTLVFSGSFDQLTDMLIFASFMFYGAIAYGVFVLRKKDPHTERPYKAWGYPLVPAIFVMFCAVLVVITCFQRPREAALGIFLIALGAIPLWYWRRKYGEKK
jgi:APA family basic amino acid/polyamine antiporter